MMIGQSQLISTRGLRPLYLKITLNTRQILRLLFRLANIYANFDL